MSNQSSMIYNNKESKNSINKTLLYLIATSKVPISRAELVKQTGLSKMTISNHISELIKTGLIAEQIANPLPSNPLGRRPLTLHISATSPCIYGALIKRTCCQSVLTDISGQIINIIQTDYKKEVTQESLLHILRSQYDHLRSHTKRRIIGCGISSIGPINNVTGYIVNPPDFYGLKDIPIVDKMKEYTGLPTYLIHDAGAGALMEKLYGNGKPFDNFIYLLIAQGIGLGFILNGNIYHGLSGKTGEIGHTTINFIGPRCSCGNIGCLELYASLTQMQNKIHALLPFFKNSSFHKMSQISWFDILNLAYSGDPVAIAALDEFCDHLSYALSNTLKLLDFSTIIVGYDSSFSAKGSNIIEKMLYTKINQSLQLHSHKLTILHSYFDGNAPLLGATSVVAKEIFDHKLQLI